MKRISLFSFLILCGSVATADGGLLDVQEVGDFDGLFEDLDRFGECVASIGDFNGDGIADVAVGEPFDDEAGAQKGAVWLLYLNDDGTVGDYDKILSPALGSHFGTSVTNLGDIDGDGVVDLGVGAYFSESAHVVLLNADATVKSHVTIEGGSYTGSNALFGFSVASIDVDGDGRGELVVGAPENLLDPQVHFFKLDAQGAVLLHGVVSEGNGGFTDTLAVFSDFGHSVSSAGDVDGDGIEDLVVGDPADNDGANEAGAAWILFMNTDATVRDHQKISATQGGFTAELSTGQHFGASVASMGNFDGGGAPDLLVGSYFTGSLWQLFLNSDGTVRSYLTYDSSDAGSEQFSFGRALATINDLNGDGVHELVVSNPDFAGGGTGRGAIYVLFPPQAVPGGRSPYGCDLNPEDSLVPTSPPAIGTTMTFEVNNPLDTQTHGATFPVLVASLVGAEECGLAIDGWHMDPTEPAGYLMALPVFELSILGDAWNGPTQPVTMELEMPDDPCLIGEIGYVQAAMVDFSDDAVVPIGLTRAWKLRLGT